MSFLVQIIKTDIPWPINAKCVYQWGSSKSKTVETVLVAANQLLVNYKRNYIGDKGIENLDMHVSTVELRMQEAQSNHSLWDGAMIDELAEP